MNHRSYLLELCSPDDFRPKPFGRDDIVVEAAGPELVERCRHMWFEVGRGFWNERAEWTRDDWGKHLGDPQVTFVILCHGSDDIGFFELTRDGDTNKTEGIGFLDTWRGKGLGGGLLTAATKRAFADGAKRIWLHTATDDHPNALPNYTRRGYRIYHEETLANPMPDA